MNPPWPPVAVVSGALRGAGPGAVKSVSLSTPQKSESAFDCTVVLTADDRLRARRGARTTVVETTTPTAIASPEAARKAAAPPVDDDQAEVRESPANRVTPTYSVAAPTTMATPRMRTPLINDMISSSGPRSVVAANTSAPIASTMDAMLTSRPNRAIDSPERDSSTCRKSSIAAISAAVIEDMSLDPIAASCWGVMSPMAAISSGVIDDMSPTGAVVTTGGAAAAAAWLPMLNAKLPAIGWASPARTLHLTPTWPDDSAGSNASLNTLPSSVVTDDGSRICPVWSRTTNPSPASVETLVNSINISLTASGTTDPFDGVDPTKAVWALTGLPPTMSPNADKATPTSVPTMTRRNTRGPTTGCGVAAMAPHPTTRCRGSFLNRRGTRSSGRSRPVAPQ